MSETLTPAGGTPANPTPTPNTPTPTPGETPKWEDWFGQQPDTVKALLNEHTSGLKSALQSERGTRGALQKQLDDLQKQLKGNDEAQKEVSRIQTELAEHNTRADFYEACGGAGATNLKRVYTLARADGLIDDKGRFKLDEVKNAYPEYFTPAKPATLVGHAGSGTQAPAPALSGNAAVNSWIRTAAGLN